MQVRVRFFASLKEAVGRDEAVLSLPEGATLEAAWQALVEENRQLEPRRKSLAAAVNRRYRRFDTALLEGDEVAFLPPVSGG